MKRHRLWALALAALAVAMLPAGASAGYDFELKAPGSLVGSDFVLGPTTPGKWGPPAMGTGATVTWSIMGAGIATDSGLTVDLATIMPAGFLAEITAAFSAWSSVADITFIMVADSGLPFNDPLATDGDIRVGAHAFDGPGGTLAHGFFPPANGATAAGDIHFDSAELWKIGFGGAGFDIFQVMAHEIGHAIGLAHTGVPASLMNPFYTEAFSGPQADDIAGAQFIYGRNLDNPVPEPASITLLIFGAVGVAGYAKRRKAA